MNNTKRIAIYFAYEGRNNNPNGDPASENRPRVYNQSNVYVTDVSSKRDDRDYLNQLFPDAIFLKQQLNEDGSAKQMDDLITDALKNKNISTHKDKAKYIINRFIDIKYFGATLTGKTKDAPKSNQGKEESSGQAPIVNSGDDNKKIDKTETIKESICGPIQKTFGMSLNYPEIIPVKITTVLATRAQSSATGSMGTKYICDYYHIHYDIIINPYSLQEWDSQLTKDDIKVFEAVQWFSIKNDITHSKINREPIIMLEIIFKDPDYYFLPSNYVTAENPKGKNYNEINVKYDNLINQINSNADHIEKLRYICNPVYAKVIEDNLINKINYNSTDKGKKDSIAIEKIEVISRDEIVKHLETYKNYTP
ncbi:MAG: type I CRISPR-associated protein Cas7 [Candidatus Cloacimonas sp.]|nr:type I CRISPR-associated protein Cas7 [Candidatus Cloacimonas sp.]